jgi:stearoyl-CoA desaturase (delta-9 desaturase)
MGKKYTWSEAAMTATMTRFRLGIFSVIAVVHVLALLAPLYTSVPAIAVCLVLYFATLCVGITFGYHRMLAHHSFDAHPTVQLAALLLGSMALQGGPLRWVEAHRKHHGHADRSGDPHSPDDGFLWSHILWLFWDHGDRSRQCHKDTSDADSLTRTAEFVERYFVVINLLAPALTLGALYVALGAEAAFAIFIWAFPVRIVAVWHATWLVNSATHRWGYRRYPTRDNSRNNALVALVTFGEGWHNNHHYDPRSARHGHVGYEVDVTYCLIRALAQIGIVWDIRQHRQPEGAD